jgi:hypothetical protein
MLFGATRRGFSSIIRLNAYALREKYRRLRDKMVVPNALRAPGTLMPQQRPRDIAYRPNRRRAAAAFLLLRMERGRLGLDLLYQFVDAINRKLVGNRFG